MASARGTRSQGHDRGPEFAFSASASNTPSSRWQPSPPSTSEMAGLYCRMSSEQFYIGQAACPHTPHTHPQTTTSLSHTHTHTLLLRPTTVAVALVLSVPACVRTCTHAHTYSTYGICYREFSSDVAPLCSFSHTPAYTKTDAHAHKSFPAMSACRQDQYRTYLMRLTQ